MAGGCDGVCVCHAPNLVMPRGILCVHSIAHFCVPVVASLGFAPRRLCAGRLIGIAGRDGAPRRQALPRRQDH
eukprot:2758241-Prymnesium_polylepis.1